MGLFTLVVVVLVAAERRPVLWEAVLGEVGNTAETQVLRCAVAVLAVPMALASFHLQAVAVLSLFVS
jgi:hypothetical protein